MSWFEKPPPLGGTPSRPIDPVRAGVFRGGAAALDAFHRALGIPAELRARGVFEVGSLWWVDGAVKLEATGRHFGRVTLWLRTDETSTAEEGGFEASVEGSDEPHPLVARMLVHFERRLRRTKREDLFRVLVADRETQEITGEPGSDDAGGGVREGREAKPKPYSHAWSPGPGEVGLWGCFFDEVVFVFSALTRVRIIAPITHVFHGHHHCLCVTPKLPTRTAWFYNSPRVTDQPLLERVRRRLGLPRVADAAPFRRLSTDMGELDAIMGAEDKLKLALAHAVAGVGERIVSLHNSCLPEVMAEDVDSAFQIARTTPQVHCLRWGMPYTHDTCLYADELEFGLEEVEVLKKLLLDPDRVRPIERDRAHHFDLVGFSDGRDTEEVVAVLESCGGVFNRLLLPDVDVEASRAAGSAHVQVVRPNSYFQEMYDEVFVHLASTSVTPPPPYGLSGTVRWVRAVTAALGLPDSIVSEAIETSTRALRPRWDALSSMASEHRIGFVTDGRSLPLLVDPDQLFGLPLLDVVLEMGFGVDVLHYDEAGDADAARKALGADRITVWPFRDRSELAELLRAGPFQAVYSDRLFERRLSRAGKAQIGFPDFEVGFRGALRTLERLVRRCRLPFFTRYARVFDRGAS